MRKLTYETLRSISATTFTGAYQAIGGPLLHAASIVKLVNNSSVIVTVSVDGVNAHDIAPAGSFFLYDVTGAHSIEYTYISKGTQYYVLGAAGTGSVYLAVLYIDGEG